MFSGSKHLFSKNLKNTTTAEVTQTPPNSPSRTVTNDWSVPLSEQEVVGFDVGVDDVDVVQPLHHVQDADGEVHDERLGHHLVAQRLVDVHGVLKESRRLV